MKLLEKTLILSLMLITIGCMKSGTESIEKIDREKIDILMEDCSFIDESKILTEEEFLAACNSISVYFYQDDLYNQCNCCLCLKLSVPTNCDGEPVCEDYEECRVDFNQNSVYLFSMSVE